MRRPISISQSVLPIRGGTLGFDIYKRVKAPETCPKTQRSKRGNMGSENTYCGVCLGWASRWCVHNTDLRTSQEVCRTSQAIQHPRAHDTSRVSMGINITVTVLTQKNCRISGNDLHFDRGVHALNYNFAVSIACLRGKFERWNVFRR